MVDRHPALFANRGSWLRDQFLFLAQGTRSHLRQHPADSSFRLAYSSFRIAYGCTPSGDGLATTDCRHPWYRGNRSGWETRCQSENRSSCRAIPVVEEMSDRWRAARSERRQTPTTSCSLRVHSRSTTHDWGHPEVDHRPLPSSVRPMVQDRNTEPLERDEMLLSSGLRGCNPHSQVWGLSCLCPRRNRFSGVAVS